jgi:hypothetical protein
VDKRISISNFSVEIVPGTTRKFLKGSLEGEPIQIFFADVLEEKKIFECSTLLLEGEFVSRQSNQPAHLLSARVVSVELHTEIPIHNLTLAERLNATGLAREFYEVKKPDPERAGEILRAIGIDEKNIRRLLFGRKISESKNPGH